MLVRFDSPRTYDNLIENLFSSDVTPKYFATPALDVYEQESEFIINAELPGVKKEDLKITFEKNILTISTTRKQEEQSEKIKVLVKEIRTKNINRSIRFGEEINAAKISAEMNNGILTITLPKTDEVKAREISIQ